MPVCVAIGQPILQMAMLRSHIDRLGLEAPGRLKGDLQQCLCDALRDGRSAKGGHASRRAGTGGKARAGVTAKQKSGGSGGGAAADGDAEEEEEDEEEEEESRRGQGKRSDQTDNSHPVPAAPVLPPGKVLFHNKAVSAMSQEERREALQELDMASLRKDDDEITHDLVEALVLRKAEAADTNPRKQAWRGRHVYMMRKAELADMLGDFELDDTGKVEEMRTRFRRALRKWAAEEIKLPAAAGAGAPAAVSDSEEDEEEDAEESSAAEGAASKRRGRSRRPTRRKEPAAAPKSKSKPPTARASRKSPSKKAAKEARSASASTSVSASSRRRGRSSSVTSVNDPEAEGTRKTRNAKTKTVSRRGGRQSAQENAAASSSSSKTSASRKAKSTGKSLSLCFFLLIKP